MRTQTYLLSEGERSFLLFLSVLPPFASGTFTSFLLSFGLDASLEVSESRLLLLEESRLLSVLRLLSSLSSPLAESLRLFGLGCSCLAFFGEGDLEELCDDLV